MECGVLDGILNRKKKDIQLKTKEIWIKNGF